MKKRPTIQMIAEQAGVSRGTVDRVLNNRAYVRGEVRAQVLEAARALGYLSPRAAHARTAGEPAARPLRLGVLLPGWADHFQAAVRAGIDKACAELADFGVQVDVRACQTDLPDEAVSLLEALAADGAQGLSVCALDHPKIAAKIDALAEADIPVITFNSDLPQSRRLCFIGQDYVRGGRVAGDLMARCLRPGQRVLAAVGNLEFNGHRQRLDGFLARLYEGGWAEDDVTVIQTFNDYTVTCRKVGEALAAHPDLPGIYMANSSIAGCVEAVRAAGVSPRPVIITHDVTDTTRALLQTDCIDFTISQDIFRQGYLPLVLLRDFLQKGRAPAPDGIVTQIGIFGKENL